MNIESPASKIQAGLQDLFQASVSPGNPYIRFQLTQDIEALLPMDRVEESLVISTEKITPIPAMPEAVIGIISSRNQVFCVFDLAQTLGLETPFTLPRTYQVIVLQTNANDNAGPKQIPIGLAVKQVQGMIRLSEHEIRTPHDLSTPLLPCLAGILPSGIGESFVIDADQLLQRIIVT